MNRYGFDMDLIWIRYGCCKKCLKSESDGERNGYSVPQMKLGTVKIGYCIPRLKIWLPNTKWTCQSGNCQSLVWFIIYSDFLGNFISFRFIAFHFHPFVVVSGHGVTGFPGLGWQRQVTIHQLDADRGWFDVPVWSSSNPGRRSVSYLSGNTVDGPAKSCTSWKRW